MYSLSRKLTEYVSPGLVLILVLVLGCFSDAVARPARQADRPAAVGAKSSDDNSLEIPGSFKDVAGARINRASKSTRAAARRLQSGEQSLSSITVDPAKGTGARTANSSLAKAKTIKIPVSLIEAGRLNDFNATAYCVKGRTASGHQTRRGVIAADPRLLPLGTVVHLQAGDYSGVYTVLDTGGLIKGRLIDVYVPTRKEALNFGRRQVKLKVLGTAPASTLASGSK